ncbi:MAG: HAD-IIB family hydrolase [Spirochaetales bacterium]|jgi:sucrose-6F-phosphate phosphohydrolase|nr:HAD-IIB family hydrolase [Spirochaetales bacterium]
MKNNLLLCCDLDRTLIPNGTALESSGARTLFTTLANQSNLTLAYVTGRDKKLVEEAIVLYNLPTPNFVIADVGATIYEISQSDQAKPWQAWDHWQARFSDDWQDKISTDIALLFTDLTALKIQERRKQKKYKLSYYLSLENEPQTLIAVMQDRLTGKDLKTELIWSVDEALDIGLLDVMPRQATKLHALEYLREQTHHSRKRTIFAGDSGNDLDVLLSPIQSILVANAHSEVKERVQSALIRKKNGAAIYLAHGGFCNMNGNYSAGVLEGVHYYAPDIYQCLEGKK